MDRQMDNPLDGRGAGPGVRQAAPPKTVTMPPPTWVRVLPILLLAVKEGDTPDARAAAEQQLQRMAIAADMAAPMHFALTLARSELREDLEAHVHSTTRLAFNWTVEAPLPSVFCDPEMEEVAQRKKVALDRVDAVIAEAEGR